MISSALLFPVAVVIWAVTAPFDRRRRALHLFTCFWASLYAWLNPAWRVTIHGRDLIERDANARARGQSPVVAGHPGSVQAVHRLQMGVQGRDLQGPGCRLNMLLNDYIPLQRGNRDSVVQMMEQIEQALAQGSSLMMFPEGTRSATGELKVRKTGAFELAVAAQVPIVPIAIEGR